MPWSADEQYRLGLRMRDALAAELSVGEPPWGVLLSGGMDSLAVLAVLRQLTPFEGAGQRRTITAYSFTLEDRESDDLICARRVAKHLGVRHVTVRLPTSLDALEEDVGALIRDGVRGKAAIECSWPVRKAIAAAAAEGCAWIATGAAADGHFGLSKKAMIHYRYPVGAFDSFRSDYFADPDKAQVKSTREWAERALGVHVVAPFHSRRMCDVTLGVPWDALNRPRQKEPLRRAFAGAMPFREPRRHTNLQLGDSGIAELFEKLARREGLGPVAYYNMVARNQLSGTLW